MNYVLRIIFFLSIVRESNLCYHERVHNPQRKDTFHEDHRD